MNYSYQFGIRYAASIGSATPYGVRLDYSRSALAPLVEGDLNEFVGVNAGTTDLVFNLNLASPCKGQFPYPFVPAQGPIDWNCNGVLEFHVAADIDNSGAANEILHGFDDWSYIKQQVQISPDVIEFTPKKMQYEHPHERRGR